MASRAFGSVLLVLGVTAFYSATGVIEWYKINEVAFVQMFVMVLLFSFAVFHLFK
jgi:hypothetical protein